MAKSKYVKKTYIKKPVKKTVIPRGMVNLGQGFPKKLTSTLKYRQFLTLTSTTGILTAYNFSAMDLFDPDVTGGGHQPMFFDQFMNLYDHFTVIGSKIKVTFVNGNSGVSPLAVGILNNDDSTTSVTTYTALSEQTQGKMRILGVSSSQAMKPLTSTYSARKVFGPSVLANNKLIGNAASGPSETYCYTVFAATLDGVTTAACYAWVEIEYIALFNELKETGQS